MTQPSHYSEARHHLDSARNARRGLASIPSALIGLGYAVLHVADAMYDVLGELADLRAAREPSILSVPDVPVQWGEGVPWTDDQWVDDDSTPQGDDHLDDETVPRPVYRPSWASDLHPLEDVDTTVVSDHRADPRWLNLLRDDV